ncbi:SpoIIE family protein phosphatase [Micromonospora sp. RTGN7]|uniref:SpoIIE family protein phosphatase n=1 Tax=Micromonospora sp. RTGN7 TaxID=3016526 RepID=UPI0029FF492C|nr:SpoIIE family protein phosphatase [Micromonospora sp. RTGN7]
MAPDGLRRVLSAVDRTTALSRTGLDAVADPALDRFAAMVGTVLSAPMALVSLVDAERQYFPGASGLGPAVQRQRQTPLSHSFCRHVVADARSFAIADARRDPRLRTNPAIEDLAVVAYAGVPLTDADGVVLGSLCVIDHQPRQWARRELDLLADLAAACSDSLRLRIAAFHAEQDRIRTEALKQRSERAFTRSQLLLRASVALSPAETVADVIATVSQLVTGSLDPAHVGVALREDGRYLAMAAAPILPPDLAARWARYPVTADVPPAVAVRTRRPVLLNDAAAVRDRFPHLVDDLNRLGWQALVSVPLNGLRGVLGALTFVWEQPYDIDVSEEAVITTLAGYVAQALERATVLDEQRTVAQTLQKALLGALPRHDRIRIAARYLPAHRTDHVGGDWYDVVTLPDDRLVLVIGDVTGHSIAAAAAMSELRSILRGLIIDRAEPPSALLRRLDHANQALGSSIMATVLLAYLDPAPDGGHRLRWSNAGHPPPTLVTPDGRIGLLPGRDPLLGAVRDAPRTDHTCHLPAGSFLLLHTDGLVESRTATIDDGFAALHRVLAHSRETDPERLADLVLRRTPELALLGGPVAEDDVALLIAATPPDPTGPDPARG